jgi:hypothetical protein
VQLGNAQHSEDRHIPDCQYVMGDTVPRLHPAGAFDAVAPRFAKPRIGHRQHREP